MLFDIVSFYFCVFYGVLDKVMVFDGLFINVVCGLFDIIVKFVMMYEFMYVIVCWDDDWCLQWWVDFILSYKMYCVVEVVVSGFDIEEVFDLFEVQIFFICEMFIVFGILIVGVVEYEVDDVIGMFVIYVDIFVDIVIGDCDFFQFVDDV